MPEPSRVDRLRQLLTSAEDVEFFMNQLKTAEWIPLLRETGLLSEPPAPVETDDGVRFPFWFASRYLVRVADQDPASVADELYRARETRNPRVWWDTVDALVKMPVAYVDRFVPYIKQWVHHPWRLSLDVSVGKLVTRLAEERARSSIDLGVDLARLVPPGDWHSDDAWVVLDSYDYEKLVPPAARALATFGPDAVLMLISELERFLPTHYEQPEGRTVDLSFIWRPAIEDHEQNWDHDREAHLVMAIRDALAIALAEAPEAFDGVVGGLLESEWPVVRRIGLHALVESGDRSPDLVVRALTDRALIDDEHHRHELYRLLATRYDALPQEAKRTFLDNVLAVAEADAEAAAERRKDGDRPIDAAVLRDVYVRRWLSAVANHLDGEDRATYDGTVERLGGQEEHPDFPSFHQSWFGSTSPLTKTELLERDPEELIDYLARWEEPSRFGPGPGVDGLRQELTTAVAEEPERFASIAVRFADLKPAYVSGLYYGLRDAIKAKRAFPWSRVLESGLRILDRHDAEGDEEHTWSGARNALAHLLEDGLDVGPAEIDAVSRDAVWAVLARLAEDSEPTPEHEAQFGPPNMDPVTYSLNTIRSSAFHSIFEFLVWHHRVAGSPEQWSVEAQDSDVVTLLDRHLDPAVDPSIAVRAAYGMRLAAMIDLDRAWAAELAPRVVGRVTTPLERAGWLGFLFGARGTIVTHELLGPAYAAFAEQLARLDAKPPDRPFPGDNIERFATHLILPWLHQPEIRSAIPLRTLLGSGRPWLVAEVVETAGHLIHATGADDVTDALATAFQELWTLVLEEASNLDDEGRSRALAPFAWWFASPLPAGWTLPELLRLLEREVIPDHDFLILDRLAEVSATFPAETVRVIEILANRGDDQWTLRTQEEDVKRVLAASVDAEDALQRQRVQALVHRLVRLGLRGVASLRRDPPP